MGNTKGIGMKKAISTKHPLERIILSAFNAQPIHTVITLLPYFGATAEFRERAGIADYRAVIGDALLYMERNGALNRDAEGNYFLRPRRRK